MGKRNRISAGNITDIPSVGKTLGGTSEVRKYSNHFRNLLELDPEMATSHLMDMTIPFAKRTILNWGHVLNWYPDAMLDFHTYEEPIINGRVGLCYKQALHQTIAVDGHTYFEGYATSTRSIIPVFHAWTSSKVSRHVSDPTWRGQVRVGKPFGYCGIPFKRDFIRQAQLDTGCYGILENLWLMKKCGQDITMEDMLDLSWYNLDKEGNIIQS